MALLETSESFSINTISTFRTNVSWISTTRNEDEACVLQLLQATISHTKEVEREPATYILPLSITVAESKGQSAF